MADAIEPLGRREPWREHGRERGAELSFANHPVLRYMYKALDDSSKESREQTYKVYHHLYDPAGTRFVTNGPHGLYPQEQYCGDIHTPVQTINASSKAWRALRDLSAVLAETGNTSE